jgi:hypothetical protein
LHNWILGHGVDEVVPDEFSWVSNDNEPQNHGGMTMLFGLTLEMYELIICGPIGAQGSAIVMMNESHRVLRLRTFLAKHY